MKLLIIDHHYAHDIAAMRAASRPGTELVVVSALYFRRRAARYLPGDVMNGPLEAYFDERYRTQRERSERECERALDELLAIESFDAIIAPSDTFFYLRSVVRRAQQLGLPFIVVQKETTIAPATMEEHSARLGRTFPFISDRMFVCSERHKTFWVRAGADPDLIDVLGQPRFDFYAEASRRLDQRRDTPRVLYLSYMLNAYARPEQFDAGASTWQQLRDESEDALVRAASAGSLELAIKPHPQQRDIAAVDARLRRLAGDAYGRTVRLIPAHDDVRPWIVESDVVVGFQTTALIEALAAGKRPVYTEWSEQVVEQRDRLIPFHDHPELFACVRSSNSLVATVLAAAGSASRADGRTQFVTEHLGPIDGLASVRVLDAIASIVGQRHAGSRPRDRRATHTWRRRARRWARRRARLRVAQSSIAVAVAQALGMVGGRRRQWRGLHERLERDRRRLAECSGRRPFGEDLIGEPDGFIRFARARLQAARDAGQGSESALTTDR